MVIDESDAHTVLQYKISFERERGYLGPCFICINRLSELHIHIAELYTKLALLKMQQCQLNGKK